MSDQTISRDIARQPHLLVSADDYDRLMELARSTAARYPADDVQQLLDELHRADIVPPDWMPQGIVAMNSYVEFRNDCTGSIRRVQLVYPYSANISQGRISVLSPVGAALIGLAEGQTIGWDTRNGQSRQLTVLRAGSKPFEDHDG